MTSAPQESHVSPLPDILSPAFAADPYGAYRTMRESAPLIHHEATDSYLVSRYEDVERVFKDKAGEFTTDNYDWQIEPVHGRTILQLSGREHTVRRALVAPAFRGTDLQEKFLPVIERNARELIDTFWRSRSAGTSVSGRCWPGRRWRPRSPNCWTRCPTCVSRTDSPPLNGASSPGVRNRCRSGSPPPPVDRATLSRCANRRRPWTR